MDETNNSPVKGHNRLAAVMAHTNRYSFCGRSRLAKDSGVSKATISRLLAGCGRPSFRVMADITQAIERELRRKIDSRELFSTDGNYPTAFVCSLAACHGCLPEWALSKDGEPLTEFGDLKPGYWSGDAHEKTGPLWRPIEEIK